ncbi:helix-turn-helix domain-containing protein [Salinispora mooreana]|uniref:helix-turn-helix domain-containing protein n=1 Tax=Salinispora mooreana TaxID=999545 RepID=UPI0009B77827|nr:helix-turn-helix transcriptional regulator [Salinispora mooreana]
MTRATPNYAPSGVEIDGAALRERRKLAGLTLTILAERAGLSLGYLSQIERGIKPTVSPPLFRRLADALDLEADPSQLRRAT